MLIELELDGVEAILANLNTRTEKAGDTDVPAADLNIECYRDRECLAFFSPTLNADFFSTASLDLAGSVALKHPELKGPHSIDGEMFGAAIKIETGIGQPMLLQDCKICKFKFSPIEGGSVGLSFQVQCKPTAEQVGRLYEWQKQKITFSLEPAEKPADDDAEK